jgi:hypothetical protein
MSECGLLGLTEGVDSRVSQERGGASTVQDGAVDLQHVTRADENLHTCTKDHNPSKGILHLENLFFNHFIVQYC